MSSWDNWIYSSPLQDYTLPNWHYDQQSSMVPGQYCALIKIFASCFLASRLSNLFYSQNHNFFLQCLRTFFSNCKKIERICYWTPVYLLSRFCQHFTIFAFSNIHLSIHQFILIFCVSQQVVDMSTFFSMHITD